MKPDDLLDYALGRLEPPRREQMERLVVGDPALAARVVRLVRSLGRLLDDGQPRGRRDETAPRRSP
jgi:anti-sigma factor RsiW